MKLSFLVYLLVLIVASPIRAQDRVSRFEFSLKTAHPNARALMKEDFYWSPIEESGPFGSDAGSDAAYGFYQWRKGHPSGSPVYYLREMIAGWHYPPLPWEEMDTVKIRKYMSISARLDEGEVERQVKMMKEYNASPAMGGGKKLSDSEVRQIVIRSEQNMGGLYLVDLDEAVIGTAFAQFVLEGKVEPALRGYAETALKREMLPLLIRQYSADAQKAHNEKMEKMLKVVRKMNG
jgi:uncharacterized protein YfeS